MGLHHPSRNGVNPIPKGLQKHSPTSLDIPVYPSALTCIRRGVGHGVLQCFGIKYFPEIC